jgi:hypothetical protein
MEDLADEGAQSAASLNDWSFRAEWTASADRDGRRYGLQDRDAWLNAASVHEHRFHRFGNAVSLDFRRAVFRHEADDESADDRNQNHPRAELSVARAYEGRREAMVKKEVGEETNQFVEQIRDRAGEHADTAGE